MGKYNQKDTKSRNKMNKISYFLKVTFNGHFNVYYTIHENKSKAYELNSCIIYITELNYNQRFVVNITDYKALQNSL